MKKIGIITYNKPHLKTQQVLNNILYKYDLYLIISPFKKFKKKKSIFKHRPYQFVGKSPKGLAKKYKLKIYDIKDNKKLNFIDFFLICGAGIIEKKNIIKNKMINCHSGIIPQSRGLDSFKWAIYKLRRVGLTLHFIDKNIDLGKIIYQVVTPLSKNDDLKNFADKHYNLEINLLSNFENYLDSKVKLLFKKEKPNLRIPLFKEKELKKKFTKYKEKYL